MNVSNMMFKIIIIFMYIRFDNKFSNAALNVAYGYSASIRVNSKVICVGAILNKRHIVTLCDCVKKVQKSPSQVTVRVGILSKDSMIVEASVIYCHKAFISDTETPDTNIAVIRTNPFTLGTSVKRVSLPDTSRNPSKTVPLKPPKRPKQGDSFIMVGWMHDAHYYTMRTDPGMRTWITIGKVARSLTDCSRNRDITERFKPKMFCAEFYHRDANNCTADRGTLMIQSGLLWGMMSYKFAKCGSYLGYFPYIDISAHLQFIIDAVHDKA